jgi:hypothetical protein
VETLDHARDLFLQYHVRYEVSTYYVVLEARSPGASPRERRIPAGFDIDLYATESDKGSVLSLENGELRKTLDELCAACREVIGPEGQNSTIEIIPSEETLVLDPSRHFEAEASVRIRISHLRGLEQPSGPSEEKARAAVVQRLHSLGVKRA